MHINKLKPYRYLGQAPKGLEATIKGGGEHKEDSKHKEDLENKEDSRADVQDDYIEKLIQLKILVNQKNLVADIQKPIYGSIELKRSFGLMDFNRNESKSGNSIER